MKALDIMFKSRAADKIFMNAQRQNRLTFVMTHTG